MIWIHISLFQSIAYLNLLVGLIILIRSGSGRDVRVPRQSFWIILLWAWLILFLFWLAWDFPKPHLQPLAKPVSPLVWGEKPVLAYFSLTPSLAGRMETSGVLDSYELELVRNVANKEAGQVSALERESKPIINDPNLTLAEKRAAIAAMGYNTRLDAILQSSIVQLKMGLGEGTYHRLVAWTEAQWREERLLHGLPAPASSPRSYQIFATRYDSKGTYTVALPDKCLKFANAGNHICDSDGYTTGQDYTVYLSYKNSAAALVLESGPWNVDDNFWAHGGDPQPRRMFRDLALGLPEAQAAYFNGYNGGVDQFGRKVTAPFAIDLARQVSIDIGLQPGVNDWITVSFMWTDGWNGGSSSSQGDGSGSTGTQVALSPVKVATPQPDGSVVHTVQAGQTLWNIAAVYEISLQDLLTLNGLEKDALIYPGESLIIKPATTSATPASISTVATTAIPTRQIAPTTSDIDTGALPEPMIETPSIEPSDTPPGEAAAGKRTPIDPLLIGIVALVVVGSGLVLSGTLFKGRG